MSGIYDWGMELPHTVEWALHCCWLLAQTDGSPVPRRRLAEFFDLPEPYLAKLLKALVAAEVLTSVPGVNGGYRLGRPSDRITVLDVVRGVSGHTTMFHCDEIRQRGPVGLTAAQCRQPCGIAKVMYGAELAWRNALAAATVADLIENAAGVSAARAARWLGPQARAGLLDESSPTRSLRTDRLRSWLAAIAAGSDRASAEQVGGEPGDVTSEAGVGPSVGGLRSQHSRLTGPT
jgi:Rrf2 family protein